MHGKLLRILRWAKFAGLLALVAIAGSTASAALGWWLASADAKPARIEEPEDERRASKLADAGPLALSDAARQQKKAELAADIADDNLFCPDCNPKARATEQAENPGPAIVPTELPFRLVATMQSADPVDSMASIQNTESGKLGVYVKDDVLGENVRLLAVGRGRVLLAHATPTGGAIEALDFPEKKKPRRGKKKKKKKKKRRKSKYELKGAREAIECDKGTCTVKRKFVQGLLANPAKLNRQAKFKSYSRGGKKGYKIYRVRRGTIGRLLGLRNGDLLTAVNGQPLDSLDRVMGMYTRLRRASHLSLTYERKGKVRELDLNII